MADKILIRRLKVPTFIGVPDDERSKVQELRVSLEMIVGKGFSGLRDNIENAVNYYEVAERVKELAMERPRKLIETLGDEVCTLILSQFDVCELVVKIEKYILTDADWVGLQMVRKK